MTIELKDARGVKIEAGDTALYGFGVGRSVAMAEGVVLGTEGEPASWTTGDGTVSITASGRVRVRVVRRSYGGGEKPVVDIAPDRLVVLKRLEYRVPGFYDEPETGTFLPPSPLPTQDEENCDSLTATMKRRLEDIERLESGGPMDEYETRTGQYPDYTHDDSPERRAYWLKLYREWVTRDRKELEAVCSRLGRSMPL